MKLIPGDILLIHTFEGILPKTVQKFQMKADAEAGYYNHSARYFGKVDGVDIIFGAEEKDWDDNKGKLKNASACFNPLEIYLNASKYKILVLRSKTSYNEARIQMLMMKWSGAPYDFKNLLGDQLMQYWTGWWWGRKKKNAAKLMLCHELTMKTDNEYSGRFPDWNRGRVADEYRDPSFDHYNLYVHPSGDWWVEKQTIKK